MNLPGKPDAGNLHVRFEEGSQGLTLAPTLTSFVVKIVYAGCSMRAGSSRGTIRWKIASAVT